MLSGAEQGSKPRDIALHCVCCMKTIYVSLTRHNKQVFLNPTPHPRAFVHHLQIVSLYIIHQICRKANLGVLFFLH